VPLREDNAEASVIYMLARNQVVTAGPGQIVDINIPAVAMLMDLYGIADRRDCLRRVRRLFHEYEMKPRDAD